MRKRNDKKTSILFKAIVFLTLIVITAIMFASLDKPKDPTDSIYRALQLMGSNIDVGEISGNLGLSIMKLILPIVSVVIGIDIIIEAVNADLLTKLEGLLSGFLNIYFVYGDNELISRYIPREPITASDGRRVRFVLVGDGEFIKAKKYILLFEDDYAAISFFEAEIRKYAEKRQSEVYMNLNDINRQNVRSRNLTTINIHDTVARNLWKKEEWLEHIYNELKESRTIKVAIIGKSALAERMIEHALCLNILGNENGIEYHLWGIGDAFLAKHYVINREIAPDRIIIHEGYNKRIDNTSIDLSEIEDMDDIFLCDNESENLRMAAELLAYTNICDNLEKPAKLYIRADSEQAVNFIETSVSSGKVSFFGTNEEDNLLKQAIIDSNSLEELGQKVNAYYNDIADSDIEARGKAWLKCSSFDKASSISSADYRDILKFLKKKNIDERMFPELEHIRWCRFSYLYNWKACESWGYGDNLNEKEKDKKLKMRSKHRHQDLIPFNQLPKEEQEKDFKIIKDIMGI